MSDVCRKVFKSTKFDAEFILVRVCTKMGPMCKLESVTEVERWAEIDSKDWERVASTFACAARPLNATTYPSTSRVRATSARNKRKRGME